jgi:hypothetical protein
VSDSDSDSGADSGSAPDREAFLAAEATDHVALYLADDLVAGVDRLAERPYAQRVADGVLLIVEGERGRALLPKLVGEDAMDFAGTAMQTEGRVERDLTGGSHDHGDAGEGDRDGNGDSDAVHALEFVFAFAEAQNEAVGDRYAEGDVVHAYARCSCGTAFSDRWVVGQE